MTDVFPRRGDIVAHTIPRTLEAKTSRFLRVRGSLICTVSSRLDPGSKLESKGEDTHRGGRSMGSWREGAEGCTYKPHRMPRILRPKGRQGRGSSSAEGTKPADIWLWTWLLVTPRNTQLLAYVI